MFTELLTLWKSQHAFTQVQGGPGRTHSHFSQNKNMYTEKTEHVSGIGLVSEGKSKKEHLSIRTWVATNLQGTEEAAKEIIRANVSFCFAAHPQFTCNLQIQRSHMAAMRVYKGSMC